ncbi:nitrogen fixation-related uncharacterized protein [Bradyrhizobium sp. AZCC 1588]|jgi:hypothetical protein|uniref:Nitrogen fixation-related uncharacterized protein n=1 Tax=Bradyrhizobium algeriense TaxID=634784 RepID=A0ABU8BHC7_9BRAD
MTIYFEIVGPYIAALMMSLGALCVFIWGVLSGAFSGANDASIRFLQREIGDDGSDANAKHDGE